ncbi:F-box/LRR-repeat protein 25-like [Capsicum galapagoense]
MERYKDRKIPIGKFELSNYYANSQVFPLIDEWLDIALQNGVKDLVVKCPLYPLPIFTILGAKSLRELVLVGCTLLPDSLYSGVVSCNSLRKLSLSSVRLDENMFQALLNSCPLVVSVTLEYCSGLEKIKSDSLKVLKIQYCGEIWEIDAPNLVTLEYICRYQIPQLKIVRESRQLKHSKFILHCLGHINVAWSCKLRKFLSNLTSWSEIFIDFRNCIAINLNDLQLDLRGSTPKVDILNVKNWESPYFLDALLWSCHPRDST